MSGFISALESLFVVKIQWYLNCISTLSFNLLHGLFSLQLWAKHLQDHTNCQYQFPYTSCKNSRKTQHRRSRDAVEKTGNLIGTPLLLSPFLTAVSLPWERIRWWWAEREKKNHRITEVEVKLFSFLSSLSQSWSFLPGFWSNTSIWQMEKNRG